MRPTPALLPLALLLLAADSPSAVLAAPAAERSTGQVEVVIEPAIPAVGVALEFAPDEKPILRDGKATPAAYLLYTFRPPAGRMFEIRLFATEGSVSMEIYRGDSKTPAPGAGAKDRTQMWMSSASGDETIRILVLGRRPGEAPFQIGAKLYPKESGK